MVVVVVVVVTAAVALAESFSKATSNEAPTAPAASTARMAAVPFYPALTHRRARIRPPQRVKLAWAGVMCADVVTRRLGDRCALVHRKLHILEPIVKVDAAAAHAHLQAPAQESILAVHGALLRPSLRKRPPTCGEVEMASW